MVNPVERRRRLMAAGVLALAGAVVWLFAALDLPAWYAAIPVVLALLALVLLAAGLRLRMRATGDSTGTTGTTGTAATTRITADLVVLALVGLVGFVVLVSRLG
jgi:hypothetical protein